MFHLCPPEKAASSIPSFSHPNVRSQKIIPDKRTFELTRPGSDGHLFNSTGCEQTFRKIVLINSGAAGQQRTFGIIKSEGDGHSRKNRGFLVLRHFSTLYFSLSLLIFISLHFKLSLLKKKTVCRSQHASVCRFKTSPSEPETGPHVS